MREHEVQPGECLSSIARSYGLRWRTIWDDDANRELRETRGSANVLRAGDVVQIPDLREKEVSVSAESSHRFRRKDVPARFRLRLAFCGRPRRDLPFRLIGDGWRTEGRTDGDGWIDVVIPPEAERAQLLVDDPQGVEEIAIAFGHLDPVEEVEGAQQRLANLGFGSPVNGELDEATEAALRRFQSRHELEVSGTLDDATREKLREVHGS